MKWFSRRPVISDKLWSAALRRHPILSRYTPEDHATLRRLAEQFLRTMQIRWATGTVARDAARVSLAVLACLPILHLDMRWYRRWRTTLLVPQDYRTESVEIDEAGVVHEGKSDAAGEFSELGTVVLSLDDLRDSGQGTGFNVVIHECAHVLDSANGALDGVPPLHADMDGVHWSSVFSSAYQDLQGRVLRGHSRGRHGGHGRHGRRRRRSTFDPYAAESPEEFFAVASELFFEKPRRLIAEYPEVHRQLARFYRQDGAGGRSPVL